MSTLKNLAMKNVAVAALALAALSASPAGAQTTDGYHSIQVFPVVVDSASFTQRFTFRNSDATAAITLGVVYFPGTDTTQATSIACPDVTVPANGQAVVTSLRSMCPTLAAGSQFGFVWTYDKSDTRKRSYSGYSRVSNAQGNGFSVEAFPAHTFTSADGVVTGVRRLAAAGGAPAFQTNCFVGKMNVFRSLDNPSPGASDVLVTVRDSAGNKLGNTTTFSVPAGKLTRLLDVFSAVGAPAGDYNDARVTFEESGTAEPGILSFCTVQDNTSFGADFRISKQEAGWSQTALAYGPYAQDEHVLRDSTMSRDTVMSGLASPRTFSIGTGSTGGNTHVIYFRHPDFVACELIDPATNVRALATYGLEIRLLGPAGDVIVGGNDQQGWGPVYLGDKPSRNNGSNSRYTIEVESAGQNTGAVRPYRLHCISGSGHTQADQVRVQEAVDRF